MRRVPGWRYPTARGRGRCRRFDAAGAALGGAAGAVAVGALDGAWAGVRTASTGAAMGATGVGATAATICGTAGGMIEAGVISDGA